MASGSAAITTDPDEGEVLVSVDSGSVTVGFNDIDAVTNILKIGNGETFTFDDVSREGTITFSKS